MKLMMAEVEDRLMSELPRRRFIVPDLLPTGPSLLYGDSGSGKTGIAVRSAMTVAGGLDWAGRPVERAGVVYVAAEDFNGVQERLLASARYLELSTADLPLLVVDPHSAGLISPAAKKQIDAEIRELVTTSGLPIGLVVVDTVSACFGPRSQDDAQFVTEFMNNIDAISRENQCAVLCLHHTGKTSPGMRGSQVFFDRADAVFKASRSGGTTTLEVQKARNVPSNDRFEFQIDGFDLDIYRSSISVQVISRLRQISRDGAAAGRQPTITEVARDTLLTLSVGGRASLKNWKVACNTVWADKSDGAQRKNFSTAKTHLEESGFIVIDGDFVTVTSFQKSVTSSVTNALLPVTVTHPPSKEGGGNRQTGRGSERGQNATVPPQPKVSSFRDREHQATHPRSSRNGTEG